MIITAHAEEDLRSFPADVQERILSKLAFYIASDNPLVFARKLHGSYLGHYRFRVGEYRVILI
jgi:mRNA-degrading endonuclease RelE of RelBE toxin-antitoxin system